VFSIILYALLACLAVRIAASLVLRRLAHPPAWVGWVYDVGFVGVWLFALVAIFLISIVISAIVVVIAALCVLVLAAERRRGRRVKPPDR
jgi:hypothetical protein